MTAWHNIGWATDVDQSGAVGPVDALLVVNELTLREHSSATTGMLPANRSDSAPFLDVRNDSTVGPLDALHVIGDLSNVFSIAEHADDDTRAGRIQPASGRNSNTRFEMLKDSDVPANIRETLELKPDDHYRGATDAPVLVIEYVDFACPVCGLFHPLIEESLQGFEGEVAVITRHLPLTSIHPNAQQAAIAAEAAGRQGMFDEMADLLFTRRLSSGWDGAANPGTIFQGFAAELGMNVSQFVQDIADPALESRVNRDSDDAVSTLGFTGTPSFVVNDQAAQNPSPSQASVNQFLQAAVDDVEFAFKLDRFSGDVRVRESALLDFEQEATISFDVMVNGGVEPVQVNLIDVAGR